MLDELLVGGELQESSKKNIIRAISAQDVLQEVGVVLSLDQIKGFHFFLFCCH